MALIGNPIVVGYNNAGQGQGYGSCTTSNQATAQKAVTLSDYNLQIGGIVAVKFPYNNTATSISLNINNKGAKPVLYRGSASIDTTLINAGDIATFIYDGTSYHLISVDRWGNSPDFKGTPTAPTAAVDTNTDQIATTKFVQNQIANTGSDDLSNDSDVDGNTISDALETLSSAENITYDNSLATHTAGSVGAEVKSLHDSIDALGSDDIANDSSSVNGATVTAALDNLQGSLTSEATARTNADNAIESAIAIVANGNTHAAIKYGQYVYIKNHNTLAEGLYKNSTSSTIAQDYALSSSNVTAVPGGGLNDIANAVQLPVTYTDNSYIAENRFYVSAYYFNGIIIFLFSISIGTAFPDATSDFEIGRISLPYSLKSTFFQYIASATDNGGTLIMSVTQSGIIRISNNSGHSISGWFRTTIPLV